MVNKMKFAREMMKKSFFIVLSLILLVFCFSIPVHADETDTTKYSAGNFYYHVHEGYVSICGYVGDDTEILIPSNIAGSPVSEIESKAFDGCDTIETITIPETVDTLYDDSFSGMNSLKKVICNTINVNINVGDGIEVEYTSVLQGNDDNTSKQQGNEEIKENPDNNTNNDTGNKTGNTNNGSKDDKAENSDIGEYSHEEPDDNANTNSENTVNTENTTNTGNTTNTDVNSSDNVTTLTPANNDSTTIDSIDTGSKKDENSNQAVVSSEDGTTQVAEGTGLLISTSDSEKAANNDTTVVTGNKKIWIIIISIAIVIVAIVVSIVLFTKSNKN